MTVRELILELTKFSLDDEIVIQNPEEMMTLLEIENLGYIPTSLGRRTIAINAIYISDAIDPKERFIIK